MEKPSILDKIDNRFPDAIKIGTYFVVRDRDFYEIEKYIFDNIKDTGQRFADIPMGAASKKSLEAQPGIISLIFRTRHIIRLSDLSQFMSTRGSSFITFNENEDYHGFN